MALARFDLKNFRDGVYDGLKKSILQCELMPGQRLVEKELISKIGTSRTPIREAIIKLEQEGLVEKLSGKAGYFVSSVGKRGIEEIFGLRKILEDYCIDLATDRIGEEEIKQLGRIIHEEELPENKKNVFTLVELDTKFHEILYKASGNQKLYEVLSNLRNQIYRYRTLSFKTRERRRISLSNHRDLFLAIKKRDKKLARKLTVDTISRSKMILMKEPLEWESPVL